MRVCGHEHLPWQHSARVINGSTLDPDQTDAVQFILRGSPLIKSGIDPLCGCYPLDSGAATKVMEIQSVK